MTVFTPAHQVPWTVSNPFRMQPGLGRLPALRCGVFFIRVMVRPLVEVLRVAPERTLGLRDALALMSDAVVTYRGMHGVRTRLLRELSAAASALDRATRIGDGA